MKRRSSWEAAEEKGRLAFRAGKPREANPYPDNRTDRGSVTFSRGYRTRWDSGWRAAQREAGCIEQQSSKPE